MNNKDITAVITSFKSKNKIINCIKSLGREIDIIVVENSNDENLKNQLENDFPNLKCILSNLNLGYAKGNNLGLSKVKTKYALIINPDAEAHSDAIDNFILTANSNPEFAIIAPYVQEVRQKKNNQIKEGVHEVKNVKGFAMFLNLEQFKDVGCFDENFCIYFEEIDLCKRVKMNKGKIYLDKSLKIYHEGGSSVDEKYKAELEKNRNWHWMWSTFYFHKKYKGFFVSFIIIIPKLI